MLTVATTSDGGAPVPPGYSPDPFAPDPSIWPEAPPWLFPATMIGTGILVVVVLVLLYLWWKSVQLNKAEQAELRNKEWIDLSTLDKRGRWRDEADAPPRGADNGKDRGETDGDEAR